MVWHVRCRVSGGTTGTREGSLKDRDGLVQEFETEEEAYTEARRIEWEMNGNPHRTATFKYWPEEGT
jgi:hypothetical protein